MQRTPLASLLGFAALWSVAGCDGCAETPCSGTVDCATETRCPALCGESVSPLPVGNSDGQEGEGEGPASGEGEGELPSGEGEGENPVSGEGEGEGEQPGEGEGEGEGPAAPPSPCGDHEPEAERCSFEDENCDGQINEGLDCTFLASSGTAVWRVDPFLGTTEHLMDVDAPGIDILFDLDVDLDGSLLATAGRTLYRVANDGSLTALETGRLPFNPNGLAVSSDGSVFIANHDTLVGSRVVRAASSSDAAEFFSALDPWDSSGDCVHHKNELFITASGQGEDHLIVMDTTTGDLGEVGGMGVVGVMGMSSAFGLLFGVTNAGDIVRIDPNTAVTEVLHSTDVAFTGAANRR